jgi:hypothetical protein
MTLQRALRDGLTLSGLIFAAYLFAVVAPVAGTVGFDAYAYWSVNLGDPYAKTAGAFGAFTYSPPIARLFAVFGLLAWIPFLWLWLALLLATAIWLGGWRALMVLAFPPVALELYHGNVHLLMAAAIVIGFRYPGTWAFVLLTKVTPGIGLLWFAARGEWRRLAIALGVAIAIVAVSVVVDAHLWQSWIRESLVPTARGKPTNQPEIPIPLLLRLPTAAAVVIWGARTGRPWTVPFAATLAMPVLWPVSFATLAAIPAINRFGVGRDPVADPELFRVNPGRDESWGEGLGELRHGAHDEQPG